jgi:hypothetical protein
MEAMNHPVTHVRLGMKLIFSPIISDHLRCEFKQIRLTKLYHLQENKSSGKLTFGVQTASVACPAL